MNYASKIVSRLRTFWIIPALLAITACSAGGPNTNVTPTMTNASYVRASAEDRAAYLSNVQGEDALLTQKNQVEYLAGRPVHYGDGRTGYTLQWNRTMRTAYVFPGHTTGAMGLDTSAMMAFATDAHGNTLAGNGGSPIVLLANVATQEGIGRFGLRLGTQVLGAGINGALAASINAAAQCSENCGSPIQVIANSGSTATATGTGTATAGTGGSCTTCGILNE